MKQSIKTDLSQNEIDELEHILYNFSNEWKIKQHQRAVKWRIYFIIAFLLALAAIFISANLWWISLAVIAYFAGSLFSMLRQNAKTNNEIIERQHQLKLVRLLHNNSESSSYFSDK